MTAQERVLRGLLDWSYHHPRARVALREAWGLVQQAGRRTGLPAPFEPELFGALPRLAAGAASDAGTGSGKRVLFLSMRGWSTHLAMETVLAHAVRQRGHEPIFLTCGGRLPICDVVPVDAGPPMPCHSCSAYATGAIGAAGFEAQRISDFVDLRAARRRAGERVAPLRTLADCQRFEEDGLPLGRLVKTSAAWFLSRGTLTDDGETAETYRRFLISASVLRVAFSEALSRISPDRVVLLNGEFFAERILCELADVRGIGVTRYEKGFITDTLLMSRWQRGAYDLDPGADAWDEAAGRALTAAEADEIDAYLAERTSGGRTFDNFWRIRVEDVEAVRAAVGLSGERPIVSAFCNILWDSAVQDKDSAFGSMSHWLGECVRWAASRPDVELVIRIHPAEVRLENHPTRERMMDYLATTFGSLPPNVHVVPPESTLSSYALVRISTACLVYTSTIGLEIASHGIPVVVAGITHYAGRGFTADATTPADYWSSLAALVAAPPAEADRERTRELARRYAHLFFFRFHQTLRAVHEEGRSRPRVTVASASELAPGRDADLDRLVGAVLGATGPVVSPPR